MVRRRIDTRKILRLAKKASLKKLKKIIGGKVVGRAISKAARKIKPKDTYSKHTDYQRHQNYSKYTRHGKSI